VYANTLKLSIIRDSNQFSPIVGKKKWVLPINRTLFKRQIQLLFINGKAGVFCCCRTLFVIWGGGGGKKQLTAAIDNGTYEYDLRQDTFTAALIPQDSHGNIYGEMIMPELFNLGKEKGLLPKDSVFFDSVTVDPGESELTPRYMGKDQDQRIWQSFKPVGPYKPISGTFASEDLKKFNYDIQKMMDRLEFIKQMEDMRALQRQEQEVKAARTAAALDDAIAAAAIDKQLQKKNEDNSPWPIDSRRGEREQEEGGT
jgi:hypothetical protein